jgi:hypothetical protein
VITDTQTAFIKDRFIIEGIVILHETIHEIHHKEMSGVLSKLILKRHMTKLIGPFCIR